jgi:hypothetical protein
MAFMILIFWQISLGKTTRVELGHKKVKYSYLRLRDWFKNKPRRIKKKPDVNFYLDLSSEKYGTPLLS